MIGLVENFFLSHLLAIEKVIRVFSSSYPADGAGLTPPSTTLHLLPSSEHIISSPPMGGVKKKNKKGFPFLFPPSSKFARVLVGSSATVQAKAEQASLELAVSPVDPPSSPIQILVGNSSSSSPLASLLPPTVLEEGLVEAISKDAVEGSSSSIDDGNQSKIVDQTTNIPEPPRKLSALIQDSVKLEEIGTPTQHVSGVPFVLIPDDNISEAKKEFQEFIYARFYNDAPAMGRVIGLVNAIWARSGPRIYVHRIGQDTNLLKVSVTRTRELLLSRNVWMIAGYPMFVSTWSPEFSPDEPQVTTAVVPVELRGVPYLLFNKQSLSRIATAVGKPVSLAPETERKENFEVAKLWVRVNLLDELPKRIVSGFSNGREVAITVTYPWLPSKCENCKKFGHDAGICPRAAVVNRKG